MATLSTNDIKIRYDIDLTKLQQATEQFDKITAEERALLRELGKLKKQLDDAAESAKKLGKNTKDGFSEANNGINTLTNSATKMVGVLGGIFAASKIIDFGKAVLDTTIKFESMRKAIDFASGSAEMGQKNFEFLRETAAKLGLDLKSTVEGYKTFASAANLAGQSSQETNRQFAAVAKAAQVMGLSAEDTKGAFMALGQMMSKGNVQAEELRGQLGERLVGAFGIAAKAMGVSTAELNKMLQKGQVLAADFLPKFATELENTFGKGNVQVTTLAASQNRFNSSIDNLILAIGNKLNPFLKGAYDLAAGIATSLERAAGGGKAKKETDAQIAARRTEAELAQKILDISIKQGVWISRQSAARALLGEIDDRINKAQLKQVDARLTKDKLKLDAATKEVAVLQEQENIYARIAGVLVNTPPPPPVEDEKERIKRLKEEYQARLNLLDLIRQQQVLMAQLRDSKLGELGAERNFAEAVYRLKREYANKGIGLIEEDVKVAKLNAELKTKNFEDAAEKEYLVAISLQDRIDQAKKDGEKKEEERYKNMLKRSKQWEKDYKKMLDDEVKARKEAEEEKQRRIQATITLTETIVMGFSNLYTANIQNEIDALNKRSETEIKLADGNQQKIDEINQRKAEKEKELKLKAWKAEQTAAVARVIFETASIVAKWTSNPVTLPLAALTLFNQAAQIGFIMSQPVPEFAEGTKGQPFKGGKAIVGERGVEKVVTESGKVYFTPPTATLVDLPKGSQVIPNHSLSRQELFLANHYAGRSSSGSPVVGKLDELGSILKALPITQLNMDERGFEKFIRTPRRTTKILNNRFRSSSS